MKVLIDACVLYPTVLREIVLGCAGAGLFTPLWSPRILAEWRYAAARETPVALIDGEIARALARFPDAEVDVPADLEASLSLPDPNDTHVLAAAINGQADALVTLNLKDFPGRALARHGVSPRHPDSLLLELCETDRRVVAEVVSDVLDALRQQTGSTASLRAVLKRASLPRLGKALEAFDA